jgi:hypothetical protein
MDDQATIARWLSVGHPIEIDILAVIHFHDDHLYFSFVVSAYHVLGRSFSAYLGCHVFLICTIKHEAPNPCANISDSSVPTKAEASEAKDRRSAQCDLLEPRLPPYEPHFPLIEAQEKQKSILRLPKPATQSRSQSRH